MSAVCIIPARGGSRRIGHKNRKLFHGKPIIQYSIDAAKESGLFERIYVSTDDPETMEIIAHQGLLLHLRSSEYLCGDEAGTQEVARDCLLNSTSGNFDYACVVYPCAPMLTAWDLRLSYAQLKEQMAVGILEFVYVEGWYYWGTVDFFLRDIPLGTPLKRSGWIDINTPEDWVRAELMYEALHREKV